MMKEKILWITPSRMRKEKLERTIDSWRNTTTGKSDFLVAIDNDDLSYNDSIKKYKDIIWEIGDPIKGTFLQLVNKIALSYMNEYKYLGFMEDDCVFKSYGYEDYFINKLKELGPTGIVHADIGSKKHDDRGYIGLPVLDSFIVKTLGFFSPPCLKSLCADDFWGIMARHLGTYYKFDNLKIQHLHWRRQNETMDEVTAVVNSHLKADKEALAKYLEKDFLTDMKKLKL